MARKKLDPVIVDIFKQYEVSAEDAMWDCHGTWVVYHKALERIAAKAGISFNPPVVFTDDYKGRGLAICVTGHLDDKAEWSIGEAAPNNNKNSYPWAMAEKRAKDRVILKLIGLHGLAFSEEEADDFKPEPDRVKVATGAHMKRRLNELDGDLRDTHSMANLMNLWNAWSEIMDEDNWPAERTDDGNYRHLARQKFTAARARIEAAPDEDNPFSEAAE